MPGTVLGMLHLLIQLILITRVLIGYYYQRPQFMEEKNSNITSISEVWHKEDVCTLTEKQFKD